MTQRQASDDNGSHGNNVNVNDPDQISIQVFGVKKQTLDASPLIRKRVVLTQDPVASG